MEVGHNAIDFRPYMSKSLIRITCHAHKLISSSVWSHSADMYTYRKYKDYVYRKMLVQEYLEK